MKSLRETGRKAGTTYYRGARFVTSPRTSESARQDSSKSLTTSTESVVPLGYEFESSGSDSSSFPDILMKIQNCREGQCSIVEEFSTGSVKFLNDATNEAQKEFCQFA